MRTPTISTAVGGVTVRATAVRVLTGLASISVATTMRTSIRVLMRSAFGTMSRRTAIAVVASTLVFSLGWARASMRIAAAGAGAILSLTLGALFQGSDITV